LDRLIPSLTRCYEFQWALLAGSILKQYREIPAVIQLHLLRKHGGHQNKIVAWLEQAIVLESREHRGPQLTLNKFWKWMDDKYKQPIEKRIEDAIEFTKNREPKPEANLRDALDNLLYLYSGHISALMFCAFLLRNSQ